jgi:hypothetical protein
MDYNWHVSLEFLPRKFEILQNAIFASSFLWYMTIVEDLYDGSETGLIKPSPIWELFLYLETERMLVA